MKWGDLTTGDRNSRQTGSVAVAVLQALAVIAIGGLVALDLTVKDAEVPLTVYAIIAGVALGISPDPRKFFGSDK